MTSSPVTQHRALSLGALLPLLFSAVPARADSPDLHPIPYQCEDTTITRIGTRLVSSDGTPYSGSGVSLNFANGVFVTDYATNPVVAQQQVGDKVQVCLVKVPHDCPDGDHRGKWYRVHDYEQQAAYIMMDSQHSCGGA